MRLHRGKVLPALAALVVAVFGAGGTVTAGGDPLFAAPEVVGDFSDFGSGRRSFGIAAGDFDENGTVDVVASIVSGHVGFFSGNGDGTFQPQVTFPWKQTFFNGWAFVAADVNNDDHLDVVWGSTATSASNDGSGIVVEDGEVRAFLGNGDGTFQETTYFVSGVRHNAGVLLGDVGDDAGSLAAGDIDDDGDTDLVVGGLSGADTVIMILVNDGGTFTPAAFFSHPKATSLGTVIYFPAPGPFGDTRNQAWGLAFGDADGDGDLDLWVGDRALYVYLYVNNGGSFELATPNSAVAGRPNVYLGHDPFRAAVGFTEALASGDFNGDDVDDLAVGLHLGVQAPSSGTVNDGFVLLDLSGGGGHAGIGAVGDVGEVARGLTAIDVDGDGLLDLLSGNYEGQVVLLRQVVDTDGDGIPDDEDDCTDSDGDQFGDPGFPANTCTDDNCPVDANPDQADADEDGAGDACDSCPNDPDDDIDGDTVCGDVDNCPAVPNADQADTDDDGLGDACDTCTDSDGDGFGDPGFGGNTCPPDNCPFTYNPGQEDVEGDGVGDACDNCRFIANGDQADADMDGAGDACPCPAEPHRSGPGFWHRQCLGLPADQGGLDPPGGGHGPQSPIEVALVDDGWLECADAVLSNLLPSVEPAPATCEAIDADPPNDPCQRAERWLATLLLDVCFASVSEHCPVEVDSAGCEASTVGDLLFEVSGLIESGQCHKAARCVAAAGSEDEPEEAGDPAGEASEAVWNDEVTDALRAIRATTGAGRVAAQYTLFGALSEIPDPRLRLQVAAGLVGRTDPGHRALLVEHLRRIAGNARAAGDLTTSEEAERLLRRLAKD